MYYVIIILIVTIITLSIWLYRLSKEKDIYKQKYKDLDDAYNQDLNDAIVAYEEQQDNKKDLQLQFDKDKTELIRQKVAEIRNLKTEIDILRKNNQELLICNEKLTAKYESLKLSDIGYETYFKNSVAPVSVKSLSSNREYTLQADIFIVKIEPTIQTSNKHSVKITPIELYFLLKIN